MIRFLGFVIMGEFELIHREAMEYSKGHLEGVEEALRHVGLSPPGIKLGKKKRIEHMIDKRNNDAKLSLVKKDKK